MKLIVGLGNPGKIYHNSRHNLGFLTIDSLAQDYRAALKKDSGAFSLSAKIKINGQNIILAKPLTFMNLSGFAIRGLVKKYKIDLKGLLVICDDLDLDFGRIKIRPSGSSAGHHGLESIIESLGSRDFARLRIGIGKPRHKDIEASDYVLSGFTRREKEAVADVIEKAADCCRAWLSEGTAGAMNIFNRRESN